MSDQVDEIAAKVVEKLGQGEHPPVNVTYAMPPKSEMDQVLGDLNMRLGIIKVLHETGWNGYEQEAVHSLRNTYPRYFRADS